MLQSLKRKSGAISIRIEKEPLVRNNIHALIYSTSMNLIIQAPQYFRLIRIMLVYHFGNFQLKDHYYLFEGFILLILYILNMLFRIS